MALSKQIFWNIPEEFDFTTLKDYLLIKKITTSIAFLITN